MNAFRGRGMYPCPSGTDSESACSGTVAGGVRGEEFKLDGELDGDEDGYTRSGRLMVPSVTVNNIQNA